MAEQRKEESFYLPNDPEKRVKRLNDLINEGWRTVSISGDVAVMYRSTGASEGKSPGRRTLLD